VSHQAFTLRGIGPASGPLPEKAMNQVELALPSDEQDPADGTGFRIGWDHAHHGLVPPPELLLEGTPIGQGWRAARAVFAGRTRPWPANRHTRRWLALRIEAWREGVPFDLATVTPNHLAQIEVSRCPVRRVPLGGGGDGAHAADAPRFVRLNAQAAFAAGNVALLSAAAAQAWQGLDTAALVRRARATEALASPPMPRPGLAEAEAASAGREALDAAAWWRLATLRSLATPLPAAEVARLPLAVLPPNRARVLNAAQALQVLLTLRLACPDWCARIGAVAAALPEHGLRTDFNLWVGALTPRLLEVQALGRDPVRALEDAWLGERVQRRWQHFVLNLGEAGCEHLVRRLAAHRLPGRGTEWLRWDQALDGWALQGAAAAPPLAEAHRAAQTLSERPPAPISAHGSVAPNVAPPEAPAAATADPAPPAARRRTAPTPFAPRPRASARPRPAAR